MLNSPLSSHAHGRRKSLRGRDGERKPVLQASSARGFLIHLLMFSAALAVLCGEVMGEVPKVFSFDAEPSTADVVLRKVAKQADTQILFPLEQLRSIQVNGLRGEYSLPQALAIVLKGTGLKAEVLQSEAIVVSVGGETQRGERKMKRFLAAIASLFTFLSTQTPAQEASAADEPAETIVVTGSLIKRSNENSQLVTNVDADELRLRAATNAVDVLEAISQNQPLATSNDGARQGALTNLANLRTLGPENTLVLINGKRIVNNPIFDNGVDLNTVPTALLDSVDILSDGASSIYGSDAVAGVINFRTRRDFSGLEYKLNALEPESRGGEVRAASLAAGLGSLEESHWNFNAGVTWRERKSIRSLDRDFSDTSRILDRGIDNALSQPFPANFSQVGTIVNANPYPCTQPLLVPGSDGGCRFDSDAAGQIDLQNPETHKSAYARFATRVAEQIISLEYLWARSSVTSALTGTTIFGYTMPNTSPYFPGNGIVPTVEGLDPTQPITVSSRFTPAGRRTTENLSDTDRLLAQIEGQLAGVDYEVWALRSTSTARLKSLQGALLISGIEDGLAGTNAAGAFINPFGAQSRAGADYLESIQIRETLARGDGKLKMAGVTLSRSLFELPAGPASLALAYEHGKDEMSYELRPINALLEGAVVGAFDEASADRSRNSVTAELLIPIVGRLEANASVRSDQYSDFGSTVNPKLLLSFDMTPSVNLHASYNEGFRAPPLPKLFAPQTLGLVSGLRNDPVLCPGGVVDTAAGGIALRDCFVAFNSLTGGNPELQPQTSKAFAVGINFQLRDSLPFGRGNLSVDYWNYEVTSTIGTLSPDAIFDNSEQFSSYIVRCSEADPLFRARSDGCRFPGGTTGDAIAYVALNNANVGKTKTAGFDFTASWYSDTRFGNVGIGYRGTYVTKYDFQRQPGEPFFSRSGAYRDGYPVIKYNHYLTLGWERNAWSASLQNRHKGGYEDCNGPCFVPTELSNNVNSYSLWNLTTSYKMNDAIGVTLHVENMFDQDPPFSNGFNSNCTGCDLRFIDPTGRAFGLTVTGNLGGSSRR